MSGIFASRARAENNAVQNKNQRTVLATLTPQEEEDVRQLLQEYQRAIVFALEITKARRVDAASLPKILTQDAKAGRAIERIREIFGVSA
jgi:FixJ family two-component response regulator